MSMKVIFIGLLIFFSSLSNAEINTGASRIIYRCELNDSVFRTTGHLVLSEAELKEWTTLDFANLQSPEHKFAAEISAGPFSSAKSLVTMNLLYHGGPGAHYVGVGFKQMPVGETPISVSATVDGVTGNLICEIEN